MRREGVHPRIAEATIRSKCRLSSKLFLKKILNVKARKNVQIKQEFIFPRFKVDACFSNELFCTTRYVNLKQVVTRAVGAGGPGGPGGTCESLSFWQISQCYPKQGGEQIMPTILLRTPLDFQTSLRPCTVGTSSTVAKRRVFTEPFRVVS